MNHWPHIMIDLETLGTEPGSVIVQVGAVALCPERGLGPHFQQWTDPQTCEDLGLTISASTIRWWMQQNPEALQVLMSPGDKKVKSIYSCLNVWFPAWLKDTGGESPAVWGNGVMFDLEHLRVAYQKLSTPVPWGYRAPRCFRTMRALYPQVEEAYQKHKKSSAAHIAVEDARAQAQALLDCEEVKELL